MDMNWYPMTENERNFYKQFEDKVRFEKYCPSNIDYLFIGESISRVEYPITEKSEIYNFYIPDTLFSSFLQTFRDVYKSEKVLGDKRFNFHLWSDFLELFKSNNCFLYDLCPIPVDHLKKEEQDLRTEICNFYEDDLTDFLQDEKPIYIFCCHESIDEIVQRSITKSGISPKLYKCSKFPKNEKHKIIFKNDLSNFLIECNKDLGS